MINYADICLDADIYFSLHRAAQGYLEAHLGVAKDSSAIGSAHTVDHDTGPVRPITSKTGFKINGFGPGFNFNYDIGYIDFWAVFNDTGQSTVNILGEPDRIWISLNHATKKIRLQVGENYVDVDAFPPYGVPVHMAFYFDALHNPTVTVYLNGKEAGQASFEAPRSDQPGLVTYYIGGNVGQDGRMQDLCLYRLDTLAAAFERDQILFPSQWVERRYMIGLIGSENPPFID